MASQEAPIQDTQPSAPEADQVASDKLEVTLSVNPNSQDMSQSQVTIAADAPDNVSMKRSGSQGTETDTDSDSEDDEHALNNSIQRLKSQPNVNSSFYRMNSSMHSLSLILHQDSLRQEPKVKYPILHRTTSGAWQKQQMVDLNVILKEYMTANKGLDIDINTLVDEIKKAKTDRQSKEAEIGGELADINKEKDKLKDKQDDLRKVTTEEKVLDMKNKKLEKECKKCDFEIEALKLKIDALNKELEDYNDEIEDDNKAIKEELEPEVEKLKKELGEVQKDTRQDIIDLITTRKKLSSEPYDIEFAAKKEPSQDLAKLLEEYRKHCIKVISAKRPEDLDKLNDEVAVKEREEKALIDQIKEMEKTKEKLGKSIITITRDITISTSKIETVTKEIEINNQNYQIDLSKLDDLISYLVSLNTELQDDYQEAYEYLLAVLLKDFGKKETIDRELKEMGILLDWGKIKQDAKAKLAADAARKGSNASTTSGSNSGSINKKGSKRKSRR